MKKVASCRCGASSFEVNGNPIGRFFCHCTICQSLYKQAFADITSFRARDVKLPADSKIKFRRFRSPPAVRRGICPECDGPVVGFMSLLPGVSLAFSPTANLPEKKDLPAPIAHIFYHSRIAEIDDPVPKVSGYWRSEWTVSRKLIGEFFR